MARSLQVVEQPRARRSPGGGGGGSDQKTPRARFKQYVKPKLEDVIEALDKLKVLSNPVMYYYTDEECAQIEEIIIPKVEEVIRAIKARDRGPQIEIEFSDE